MIKASFLSQISIFCPLEKAWISVYDSYNRSGPLLNFVNSILNINMPLKNKSVCTSSSYMRPNVVMIWLTEIYYILCAKWYIWVEVVTQYTVEAEVLCTVPFLLCVHVHTNCGCVGGPEMIPRRQEHLIDWYVNAGLSEIWQSLVKLPQLLTTSYFT